MYIAVFVLFYFYLFIFFINKDLSTSGTFYETHKS